MSNILENLNSQQKKAVEILDVPLKIIAGPGSGKTKVLTAKIAYIIQHQQIVSSKILALTFTNKAAAEMKNRVQKILNTDTNVRPFISTFHAFCARVLREDHKFVGLTKNFTIIDAGDQKTILRRIIKESKILDSEVKLDKFLKQATYKISAWKNSLDNFAEITESLSYSPNFLDEKKFFTIYKLYKEYLQIQNFVDFDDLQALVYSLFRDNSEILEKWRNRFTYVLVDEFQDTNDLQFQLIVFLTKNKNNLTVVGDTDQTIYTWRGAKPDIMEHFSHYFPNAVKVVLHENYRSSQEILDLANNFIEHNQIREKKQLVAAKEFNQILGKPQLKQCSSRYSEAKFVVNEIQSLIKSNNYTYSDFFILYRANYLSLDFETVLTTAKIPFQLVGAIKFRERRVIKEAMAFLKAVAIKDDFSMHKILELTPKIGPVSLGKITNLANELNITLYELLVDQYEQLQTINKNLNQLQSTVLKCSEMVENNEKVETIMQTVLVESGYWERAEHLDTVDEDNKNHLNQLLDQLSKFDSDFASENYSEENRTFAFLQEESLINNEENLEPNKVTLLTIHAAKGLENRVVFIVGLNKEIFPSKNSLFTKRDLEEERRTLYVGMTRAEERLYLSYVEGEFSFITGKELERSPFINELNVNDYESEEKNVAYNDRKITWQKPPVDSPENLQKAPMFKKNDLVRHMLLGDGVVMNVCEGKYQIAFSNPKVGVRSIPINHYILRKK